MDDRTSELERRAHDRVLLELMNRTAMTTVHGTALFVIGLMMALTGAPAPIENAWGPWSRLILGLTAMVIGMTILYGATETDNDRRGWVALTVGFAFGMLWHLGLAIVYAIAAFQSQMVILMPGQSLDPSITNRGYIPWIYLGYVALTLIHARTVWRLGPPPR